LNLPPGKNLLSNEETAEKPSLPSNSSCHKTWRGVPLYLSLNNITASTRIPIVVHTIHDAMLMFNICIRDSNEIEYELALYFPDDFILVDRKRSVPEESRPPID